MTDNIATVFGASGFVGRHVVRELAAKGWRVRAAVRNPAEAEFLRPMGAVGQIEIVQANVRYRTSIADALIGAKAAVNLVGILAESGQQKFRSVQTMGAQNIAELAKSAGVERLVHLSAIGADAESDSEYAKTKAEGEQAVRDKFAEATILRPSIIFGPQDGFFNRFASMAQTAPALPLIGGGKTKFQPVYVDDVADCVVKAATEAGFGGRTFELGGPEVKSFRELMELMLNMIGRNRALVPIPFFAASGLGKMGDIAGALPFVEAPITEDQVKLLRHDNVVGASGETVGTISDFGISPETMATILPTYLVRYRKAGQFTPETI